MWSRYFKLRSSGNKDKGISLMIENGPNGVYTVKVLQNVLTEHSETFRKMAQEGKFKKKKKVKLDQVTITALHKILE
ncbi:hypothetical protein X975_20500, partial [Stegodyphus mimosarum]